MMSGMTRRRRLTTIHLLLSKQHLNPTQDPLGQAGNIFTIRGGRYNAAAEEVFHYSVNILAQNGSGMNNNNTSFP